MRSGSGSGSGSGAGVAEAAAAVGLLDDLLDRLRSVDPGSLSNNGLTAVARRARGIERAAAGLVATVGAEANRRKEQADREAKAAARAAAPAGPGADADGGFGCDDGTGTGPETTSGAGERPLGRDDLGSDPGGPGGSGSGAGSGGAEDALWDPSVSARQARVEVRRAEIAHRFPGFGAAVARGSVSVEHLDVLFWAVEPLNADVVGLLVGQSAVLVSQAERHPPRLFAKVLRALIDTLCSVAADELAAAQRAESEVVCGRSAAGRGHFRGGLDPERFNLLVNAVEAQATAMVRDAERDGVTLARSANLNVAALIDLVTRPDRSGDGSGGGGPGGGPGGGGGRRPLIHLLVDAKTIIDGRHEATVCETVDGDPLPLTVLGRYAYGAAIQAIGLGDDGLPLRVGRQYRSATAAQWAALTAIYSHCGWPGCDQPVSRCQAHHLWFWEDGGPTDLDNLIPLCTAHHVLVHHRGWRLRLGTGRRLDVTRPNGEHFATAWPNRTPRNDTHGEDALGSPGDRRRDRAGDGSDHDRADPAARSGRSGREPP